MSRPRIRTRHLKRRCSVCKDTASRFIDIGPDRRWYCATHLVFPRLPKLRNPEEHEIVPDSEELQKARDEWNSAHRPPVTLEDLPVLPQVSAEETDRLIDEQIRLAELMSGNEQGDDNGHEKENTGS